MTADHTTEPEGEPSAEGEVEESSENAAAENLKALKLLHQILMVVSAAVLAFALRPDLSAEYRDAIGELLTLREVSLAFNDWPNFLHEHFKANEDENTKFVLAAVRLAGLGIQGHPRLSGPLFGDPPPNLQGAKLFEFDAFFSGTRRIGVVRVEGNKNYIAEQLRKAAAGRNAHPSVSAISASGVGSYGYYGLSGRENVPDTGPMNLSFVIFDQPQTAPNGPVFATASFVVISNSGNFALDWLRTQKPGRELIDARTESVFPHLKVFWERVNTLTEDQAMIFLQDELSANGRGTLSFFGIPIERNVAVGVGPALCIAILLFLALHLRHFLGWVPRHVITKRYPWVALFGGPLGLTVTYGSVMLLPTVANLALLYRYGHLADLSTRVGLALTCLMLLMGVWTMVEIHRLRRRD